MTDNNDARFISLIEHRSFDVLIPVLFSAVRHKKRDALLGAWGGLGLSEYKRKSATTIDLQLSLI